MPELQLATFTEEALRALSRSRGEPAWLLDHRLRAAEIFARLPLEQSPLYAKYADLGDLDFSTLGGPTAVATHREAGSEPEGLGVVQVGTDVVQTLVPPELAREGLVVAEIGRAIREWPDLVEPWFAQQAIPPGDDKFAAFNNAFFNAGLFVFVPHGLSINVPLTHLVLAGASGSAVITRNLIHVEADGRAGFLEQLFATNQTESGFALFSNVTEVHLGSSAEFRFASIQGLGANVGVFTNRRAVCGADARMGWTTCALGGALTRSRVDTVMQGPGSFSEDVEIVFGNGRQRFDFNADLTFRGPNTTGTAVAKGVLLEKARTIFKGMIRIGKEAKNANAYLAEHAMILDPGARADSIPGLEIETNEVKATHAASVAQIDEEQVFYLMSRGLPREEARKTIVLAYLEPAVTRIPSFPIRRQIRYLLEQKWDGRPIDYRRTGEFQPEVLVEIEEEQPAAKDVFERHYKYR